MLNSTVHDILNVILFGNINHYSMLVPHIQIPHVQVPHLTGIHFLQILLTFQTAFSQFGIFKKVFKEILVNDRLCLHFSQNLLISRNGKK